MYGYEKSAFRYADALIGYLQVVKCVCRLPKSPDFIRVCRIVFINTRTSGVAPTDIPCTHPAL